MLYSKEAAAVSETSLHIKRTLVSSAAKLLLQKKLPVFSPVSCPDDNPRHFNIDSPKGAVSPLSTDSVFDFSGDANNSSYLTMTGKEQIFSPGHADDNPFKYSPHKEKEQSAKMKHFKQMNLPSSDSYVNMGQKHRTETNFENPTYLMTKSSEI
jgi:hypothetical protein